MNSLNINQCLHTYIGELEYEVKHLKGKSKEYCREKGLITHFTVKVQPLIEKEVFDKVQNRIETNRKKSKNNKYEYLLVDLLYCGNCKKKLNGRTNKKNYISLYSCHSNINKWRDDRYPKCNNFKSMNVEVTDMVNMWLLEKKSNSWYTKLWVST